MNGRARPSNKLASGILPYGSRRRTVLAILAAYAGSSISSALAAPGEDRSRDAFMTISKALTARTSLDPALGARLHQALSDGDPQFSSMVLTLAALVESRKIEPSNLQRMLDAEHSEFAALPRRILTAWYAGVIGEGENARCVAFEANLMNVVVSNRLTPPSYCYGDYGSWVRKPV